jgi:hypothetical protein
VTLVWHYTVGACITEIFRSRCITPTTVNVPIHEHPIVWFSANQEWEKTAWKALQTDTGEIRNLYTREEMAAYCDGLYRIGMKPNLLKPWSRLQKLAHIKVAEVRGLEKVARDLGANPFDWWGTIFPVTVDQWESLQVLKGEVWTELPQDAAVGPDAQGETHSSPETLSLSPKNDPKSFSAR